MMYFDVSASMLNMHDQTQKQLKSTFPLPKHYFLVLLFGFVWVMKTALVGDNGSVITTLDFNRTIMVWLRAGWSTEKTSKTKYKQRASHGGITCNENRLRCFQQKFKSFIMSSERQKIEVCHT